jgi:hypothetical protein
VHPPAARRPGRPERVSDPSWSAAGHTVETLSRRLSAIRLAHQLADHPDPKATARITAVWEVIQRTHGAPPAQAAPLMPPELFDVVAACPDQRHYRTRPAEPDVVGLRDRALLLVGIFAALGRSELTALVVEPITEHPRGLVLELPRSKTNQTGTVAELVVLPCATRPERCPITALHAWLDVAAITAGPALRKVTKANRPTGRGLHPTSAADLVGALAARRVRHLRPPAGASDRAIAHQKDPTPLAGLGRGRMCGSTRLGGHAVTMLGL